MSRYVTNNTDWREGKPPKVKDRPVCAGCGKPRTPWTFSDGKWCYRGYGYFCTLRCACDYANRKVKERLP